MPRIIDDELFERVQRTLDRNKKAPARKRGKDEYLLTTKLFCGYCKEMMIGLSLIHIYLILLISNHTAPTIVMIVAT